MAVATLVADRPALRRHPQGLLPGAGHRRDPGHLRGAADRLVRGDGRAAAGARRRRSCKDPAVESLSSFIGIDGTNTTLNSGRIQINLKPLDERRIDASDVIRRLQPAAGEGRGHHALHAAGAGPDRRGPRQPHAVSSTAWRTPTAASCADWVPRFVEQLQALPELRDVASDQQNAGPAGAHRHRPRHGVAAGHHAADDRRHALRRVRPAAGLDHVHAAEPVPRRARGRAATSSGTRTTSTHVYLRSAAGGSVPLRAFATRRDDDRAAGRSTTRDSSRSSPSPSTSRPAPRSARRCARSSRRAHDLGLPASIQAGFQGTAQAFRRRSPTQPFLILAAIVTVYIVLGVLYESYIHPITILSTLPSAGVGALLALMLCRTDFSRDRADRHHPADRHRRRRTRS